MNIEFYKMGKKILKFSSSWCFPCRILKQTFDDILKMEEFKNIEVIELDVDDPNNNELCFKHQVRSIPTLVMLDENDNVLNKIMGAVPKNNLIDILKQTYNV